jgi:hypothetical protein
MTVRRTAPNRSEQCGGGDCSNRDHSDEEQ